MRLIIFLVGIFTSVSIMAQIDYPPFGNTKEPIDFPLKEGPAKCAVYAPSYPGDKNANCGNPNFGDTYRCCTCASDNRGFNTNERSSICWMYFGLQNQSRNFAVYFDKLACVIEIYGLSAYPDPEVGRMLASFRMDELRWEANTYNRNWTDQRLYQIYMWDDSRAYQLNYPLSNNSGVRKDQIRVMDKLLGTIEEYRQTCRQ